MKAALIAGLCVFLSQFAVPFAPYKAFAQDAQEGVAPVTQDAQATPKLTEEPPVLVTFGLRADQDEGDHDYRQIVRFSVPAGSGRLFVRIFDPNVGGEYDEPNKGFNSRTRFTLFGKGAEARLLRDEEGVIQEVVEGEAIDAQEFGFAEALDGLWFDAFEINARDGAGEGALREFFILVEGVVGNDGNVFDIGVTDVRADPDRLAENVAGLRIYSYAPTFQLAPDPVDLVELRFSVPDDARTLTIENFDSAGAEIAYAGRFRSRPLEASGKSEWARDIFRLYNGEFGVIGSITARSGEESPNDMTIFTGVSEFAPDDNPRSKSKGDPVLRPVAIELPARRFTVRPRPQIAFETTPLACGVMRLDGSASVADRGPVMQRWQPEVGAEWIEGAIVETAYDTTGNKIAQLQIMNDSGMVGSGQRRNIPLLVKQSPLAAFDMPALVGQEEGGTPVTFDGEASRPSPLPAGNVITRYEWDFGDGTKLTQIRHDSEDDADFGVPTYIYAKPGTYTVTLTVTDDPDHPCNTNSVSREITINATPIADAGGDLELIAGEPHAFDASQSSDPDGALIAWQWDFGNDRTSDRQKVPHTYHEAGEYKVTLTVTDDTIGEERSHTDTINVLVADRANTPPVARAGEDRVAVVGERLQFDATPSNDEDGRILHYDWEFGDGASANDPVIEHTFWQPGEYTVMLIVTDDRGLGNSASEDTAIVTVAPAPNAPPAIEMAREFDAVVFEPFRFDASAAADPDGSIVSYEWDFGDGGTGSGPVVDHLYTAPGEYEGVLRLTDNGKPEPLIAEHRFKVAANHRANQLPIANAGADLDALVGEAVEFDASQSDDADGSILKYEWEYGDGHTATGVKTTHIYQFPGTYEAVLSVYDENRRVRLKTNDKRVVNVTWPQNVLPVSRPGGDIEVVVGEIIQFDGSASSDEDGNILKFDWDFGDGGKSPDEKPRHAFHDPGTYQVTLTVTDDAPEPESASATVTVTVKERDQQENQQ